MMHRRVSNAISPTTPATTTVPRRTQRRPTTIRSTSSGWDWNFLAYASLVFVGTFGVVLFFLMGVTSLWKAHTMSQTEPLDEEASSPVRNMHQISPTKGATRVEELQVLPWNPIYQIPDSMSVVGDRSDEYVSLRKEVDATLRDRDAVNELFQQLTRQQLTYTPRPMENSNSDQFVSYDIYHCPETPPPGYPFAWRTWDIVTAWPTDDVQAPQDEQGRGLVHQSLCVFDYEMDFQKAMNYREAQLPFVVINDPAVEKVAARWSLPHYMHRLLGNVPHRTEYSENNHFMYYIPQNHRKNNPNNNKHNNNKNTKKPHGNPALPQDWKEPTQMMRMTYPEWYQHAQTPRHGRNDPHWYYRLIGCGGQGNDGSCDYGSSEYLFDELPFFQPQPNLYIAEPNEQKGIHCRFGMTGVIAENHFDGSRNTIALFSGSRRYILSHPDQCQELALYPKGHPSARHSAIDWSNPDLTTYPQFQNARSTEVVLQPGQVLYLPTVWFHYIVSLETNMQCNTRSGVEPNLMKYVHECGF